MILFIFFQNYSKVDTVYILSKLLKSRYCLYSFKTTQK
jgi:hypothetical protein